MGSNRLINRNATDLNKGLFNRFNLFNVCFSLGVFILFDSISFLKQKIGFSKFVHNNRKVYQKRRSKYQFKKMSHIFIVLVSLSSCNDTFQYEILSSPVGSEILNYPVPNQLSIPEGIESVRVAANNWNKAVGRQLFCTKCDAYPIKIEFVDDLRSITGKDEKDHAAITMRKPNECLIYFRNHSSQFIYSELAVAIHELGHCVGFGHSTFKPSIMNAEIVDDTFFTTEIVRIANGD